MCCMAVPHFFFFLVTGRNILGSPTAVWEVLLPSHSQIRHSLLQLKTAASQHKSVFPLPSSPQEHSGNLRLEHQRKYKSKLLCKGNYIGSRLNHWISPIGLGICWASVTGTWLESFILLSSFIILKYSPWQISLSKKRWKHFVVWS